MAIEDAVHLARAIHKNEGKNLDEAIKDYDTWAHWFRCSALVLLSRYCGEIYMSSWWLIRLLVLACLSWPFNLVFVVVIRFLLFWCAKDLRSFADKNISNKSN